MCDKWSYIDFCSIQAVLIHHAEEGNDPNQKGVISEQMLALNDRVLPRECWDGSRRSCRANGVVDGSSPAAEGRSPVCQGGSCYRIWETGHWRSRKISGRSKSNKSEASSKRGDSTCVELRRIHRPHHRVEFPSRSWEVNTAFQLNPVDFIFQTEVGMNLVTSHLRFLRLRAASVASWSRLWLWRCLPEHRTMDRATLTESLPLPLAAAPHLDLPAFHNGSVQLLSGPVGLSRILEGHEAKSLQVGEVERFR